MILMNGLGGLDRTAAANYCGQKFGVTSIDFQPCVNFYAAGMSGDYKPQASGNSGSGGGGSTFDWNGLISSITQGAVTGLIHKDPTGGNVVLLPPPPKPAWYMTPVGMIGIVGGAVALFLLLKK